MDPLIAAAFGAAGVPAGFIVDTLIDRLAVPFEEDEEAGEGGEEASAEDSAASAAQAPRDSERGALALEAPETDGGAWRQVAVVAGTAGLFAAAGARYPEAWQAAIVCAYLVVLLVCTVTDLLVFRVPDVMTFPGMLLALVVGLTVPGSEWSRPLLGAALAGSLLLLPAIATRGKMGMGDVKLATFGGLALGFRLVLPALLIMALAGGLVALVMLAVLRRGRQTAMPYAPYIALGIGVVLLLQGTAFHELH